MTRAEQAAALDRGWFGGEDKGNFVHRSWMKNQGFPADLFDGRPVIGICNTWSELTPCNAHLREIADHVKRGVYASGGFPVEFPVMSLGESNLRPSSMMFRNLASMDVEETIRANPIDGVVLLVGCDKTTPACVMGAASCDLPTIVAPGGPDADRDIPRPAARLRNRRLPPERGGSRRGRIIGGRFPIGRKCHEPVWRAAAILWARPPPWPRWPRR